MADECLFVPEGDSFQRVRSSRAQRRAWCLPGSRSICGAPSRASASRRASPVLREGRKARTVEASLVQGGKPVARGTAVFLRVDPALNAAPVDRTPPRLGPDAGRPIADVARRWSPFFTGVDTRTVDGNLLKPGPAACWFNLERALVPGETNSALVHTVSAADFASGISAVVNLREATFVNADLTLVFWRRPRTPWILLSSETHVGDQGAEGETRQGRRVMRRPSSAITTPVD